MEGAGFGAVHAGNLLESEMELGNHSVPSSSDWDGESDRESEFSSYSYGSDLFASVSEAQLSGTSPCNNGMLRLGMALCQIATVFKRINHFIKF